MKNAMSTLMTLAIALSAAFYVQAASAATQVSCSDTVSEGYVVKIQQGGYTGSNLFADVTLSSYAGPVQVAYFPVSMKGKGNQQTYFSSGFKLTIDLKSDVSNGKHRARMNLQNDAGYPQKANLICSISG